MSTMTKRPATPAQVAARERRTALARRRRLGAILVAAAVLALLAAGGLALRSRGTAVDEPHAARFAAYGAADEPDGDLATIVWPEFVTRAGPEIQRLYAFNVTHGDLMRYMPCFCGCGGDGHRNNRDCFITSVGADGTVVFDDMAPT
jgi:hypothetical protein